MENCGDSEAYVAQPKEVNHWSNVFNFIIYILYIEVVS